MDSTYSVSATLDRTLPEAGCLPWRLERANMVIRHTTAENVGMPGQPVIGL